MEYKKTYYFTSFVFYMLAFSTKDNNCGIACNAQFYEIKQYIPKEYKIQCNKNLNVQNLQEYQHNCEGHEKYFSEGHKSQNIA